MGLVYLFPCLLSVQLVKDNMKEFQAWSWIEERQAHYMNNLQKVYEEQERARKEFEKQEGLTSSQQTITPASKAGEESSAFTEATDHDHKMDCAVEHAPGGY